MHRAASQELAMTKRHRIDWNTWEATTEGTDTMPNPNEIDMTCAVCGGTWGEPNRVYRTAMGPTERHICPADCHDEAKWAALAALQWALEKITALYEKQEARIAELEKLLKLVEDHELCDSCHKAIDAARGDKP